MSFGRLFIFFGNIILIFLFTGFLKMQILDKCVGKILINPYNFISLTTVENDGAAFNMFAGLSWLLIIFAIVILVVCSWYVLTYKFYISDKFLLSLAVFCAGIVGNTYERIVYGFVTDYIKINVINFPIFNLYDILITFGAITIVFAIINDKIKEQQDIEECENDFILGKK